MISKTEYQLNVRLGSVSSPQVLGSLGEDYATLKLEKAGYRCKVALKGEKQGDIKVVDPETGEFFRVEVKTARMGSGGDFWFRLYHGKHCTIKSVDYVVLNCVRSSGLVTSFIVPQTEIQAKHAIRLVGRPEVYSGKYAKYRQPEKWLLFNIIQ
jgi:hypothetical protein